MKTIDIQTALDWENKIFVDVRSPLEYEEDHIPGAINIPILDNEERVIIGTIYKQEGKENAIRRGLDFVSPKLKELYQRLKDLNQQYDEIVIYCFRGGMRSSSVVDFARSCGLTLSKLEGGYKSYRRHVMEYLENIGAYFKFVVLHGHTCIGKTEMLLALEKENMGVLDLEFFAKNSGSVFGDIFYKGKRPSQKFFETQLFAKLQSLQKNKIRYVFMESESKKIGRCTLSAHFWKMMQEGKHILVEASLAARVARCVHDYTLKSPDNDEQLISSVENLKDKLGKERVKELIEQIKQKKYAEVAEYLMVHYYDCLYLHSQDKYQYEFTVCSDDMNKSVETILQWYKELE